MSERRNAVYNPHNKPESELPTIYGFNNGGSPGWLHALLIAEDGVTLGSHVCSNEGFMPGDLGIIEGTRSDRHRCFREHYPDGYRMQFVSGRDVESTPALLAAFERNKASAPAPKGSDTSVTVEFSE